MTLIEVLIVVVIMAVLAGAVLPHFISSADSAKESSLKANLAGMRAQIELYRIDHTSYPKIISGDLPQLVASTNESGAIGAAGPDYSLGPYIAQELPPNAFDDSNEVSAVAQPGEKPTAAVGSCRGWQYDESTGDIWPNHPAYYTPGEMEGEASEEIGVQAQ